MKEEMSAEEFFLLLRNCIQAEIKMHADPNRSKVKLAYESWANLTNKINKLMLNDSAKGGA